GEPFVSSKEMSDEAVLTKIRVALDDLTEEADRVAGIYDGRPEILKYIQTWTSPDLRSGFTRRHFEFVLIPSRDLRQEAAFLQFIHEAQVDEILYPGFSRLRVELGPHLSTTSSNASISICYGERILLRSLTSAGNRLSRCPRASGAFSRSPPPP